MLSPGQTRPAVLAALFTCCGAASAATLAVDAPNGCLDPPTIEQEAENLVGRPLAEVQEADFRLTITPQPGGRWHLKLESVEHRSGAVSVRELNGQSCNELEDAAALAIAVSIRALAESAPRPAPATAATPTAADVPAVIARPPAPVQGARHRWAPSLTLSVAADNGDLPNTGMGVMAGGAVQHRWLRLAGTLGWMPPRDAVMTGGSGRFQLAFGAADGCFAPVWSAWTLMTCLGGELGGYHASGLGIAHPDSHTTFWRAGRASLGAALALSSAVSLLFVSTAVVPWSRPGFVVDGGATQVYRPGAVAVRLGGGLDFRF